MATRLSPPYPSDDRAGPAPLLVDISDLDANTLVVTPVGEADLCTVPDLRQVLEEVTAVDRSRIIIDLDRLTFMDASALGVLVAARQRLSATGRTLLVRCRAPHKQRMLSLTGLDHMLDRRT